MLFLISRNKQLTTDVLNFARGQNFFDTKIMRCVQHNNKKSFIQLTTFFSWLVFQFFSMLWIEEVCKVLSLLEACFDLISGSSLSMKIQIIGGKNYWKSGVQIPVPEGQNFFFLFSFHFPILHTKVVIFYSNHFLISCLINLNKTFLFLWISDL